MEGKNVNSSSDTIGNKSIKKCSCMGYNLDKLIQPLVLEILMEEKLYGYAILKKIEERWGMNGDIPDSTGLYRTLGNMQKQEILTFEWETQETGPAKKVYSITEEGKKCYRSWIETLRSYYEYIGSIIEAGENMS
ncbi:DNA-binding transcriptional regulator, PadR family [Dethiosulfatibacter aminovorans DSM 17477]|uniref:DNA-binding transcriptional regulator, PadR family n=1 Tax=Dethiosulfatibacter aminovorans DSM 17477 TaxID=1121476 RepID=A0A1M6F659_9FIRM|nr:PadR family transcriptional regulator [Dethiosulfatibacter aminovorans]SHI93214.1 DNA-binding transcriptional regulator, PadR family [Dethiosulfatibacter aminovorans DSM 17477]